MAVFSRKIVPATAFACLLAVAALAYSIGSPKLAVASLIGGLAGFSLYHAKFGFTGAWHRFASQQRGGGLRWQILLILMVCIFSYPLIEFGDLWGINANGYVLPFGVRAALGAFIFGLGMQLGGSCASGTLFTVGGGSTRMVITLIFFVLGSVIATAHLPQWANLPKLPSYSLINDFGSMNAILITAIALGLVVLVTMEVERKCHGTLAETPKTESIVAGPWSYFLGALALAAVSIGTLVVLGRPWGVSSGFALWGAKWFQYLGIPVETWQYWVNRKWALDMSVFAHSTSVMNFGIVFGAMMASGLAGRFSPKFSVSAKGLATAIIGGLMMGYGARLAYGCNIGAYLGGIISGSLHGWGWLVFGFMGSVVGSKIRDRVNAF